MKSQKKKKTNTMFYKILSFTLIITALVSSSLIYYFNVLPLKYFIPFCLILWVLTLITVFKLNMKMSIFSRIIVSLFSFLMILAEAFGISYAVGTLSFMNSIFDTGYQTENYNLYVLKDSHYTKLKDLENKEIIIYNNDSESLEKALANLNNKISFNSTDETDLDVAVNKLIDHKTDGLFISESLMNIFYEEHKEELSNLKVIASIPILIKKAEKLKKVNVTKDSFIIYLSGIDTYGSIKNVARSDVNLLLVVNPVKEKILMINTPRDYYVTLGVKNKLDKLTHAGIYGIEESARTLGLLYGIDINYYFRVNFTSFMNIIDTLNGITVNSKYNFSYDGYSFTKGTNKLNAKSALAFSRARKMLPEGDISRGYNQLAVIEGIVNKASDIKLLTKYNTILNKLENGIITNMDQKTISKLVNLQLDKNIKWKFDTYTVTGTNASKTTYSTGSYKVSVIEPDLASINEAKVKIKSVKDS